ncbi:MAG: hypothetical protein GY856_14705 [bacterium]|nr:hypothetical protein [bacterium]
MARQPPAGPHEASIEALPLSRKIAFSLLPLLLLAAGAELWFRLHPHEDAYRTHTGFVEPDPDLIWRLKPQSAGPLATNELGLRDTPYRADADVKILLLGDSVSWGNGIHDVRRIYPTLLEQKLSQGYGPRSFEVINAAVPGYSTFQELRYLELYGLALEPDAVVVQFCLNDVGERYEALAQYGGNNYFLGVDTREAVRGLQGTLIRNSRAYEAVVRALQGQARGREEYRARNLARDQLSPAQERAWQQMLRELDGIRRLAAEHDLPLLVLIAPFRFQIEEPGRRQPQDRLLELARGHGPPTIDVLGELEELSPGLAAAAFNDETHFSELGHALTAELLLDPVARLVGDPGSGPSPGPAERWAETAAEMARHGDYQEALELLAEAEGRAPDYVRIYQYQANVAYLRGDRDAAIAALRKGLEIEPEHALLQRNLEHLEPLR